jgi:hypothetical protein
MSSLRTNGAQAFLFKNLAKVRLKQSCSANKGHTKEGIVTTCKLSDNEVNE